MVFELVPMRVRLEPRRPSLIRSLQSTIVGQVLAQSQLAIDVVLAALGILDGEIAVLINEALGTGFEFFEG